MDGIRLILETAKREKLAEGRLAGLFALALVGKIEREGQVLACGTTWRHLAEMLKIVRWNKHQVTELGLVVKSLPPRDRVKFWYQAIQSVPLNSPGTVQQCREIAHSLLAHGYCVHLPNWQGVHDSR